MRIQPLLTFISFCFKNYLRQHRYLRDLIAIVIFSIFFGGFLSSTQLEENIWIIFTVFAVLLNLLTAPSLFFLEKGNTLYFMLSKPDGRKNLFLSKIFLIILIDLTWVFCFAIVYGLRFLDLHYFLSLPLRMSFVLVILLLSTLLLSLAYTYRPVLSWVIFVLLIFGFIVNKAAFFPLNSATEILKIFAFGLPPFFEITSLTVTLGFSSWDMVFLGVALLQVAILFVISVRKMMRKDLV